MNMMSDNINELMAALSKAQGVIEHAAKDKANPFFKSKYADLASVWDVCRKPLSDNGLAVVQTISKNESGMILITTLGHSSGQWIRSEMPILVGKLDPQSLGSALTYTRRYSLSSIVGVAPDDDDDGEKAQQAFRTEKKPEKVFDEAKTIELFRHFPAEDLGFVQDYLNKWAKAHQKVFGEAVLHFLQPEPLIKFKEGFQTWKEKQQ